VHIGLGFHDIYKYRNNPISNKLSFKMILISDLCNISSFDDLNLLELHINNKTH